MTFGVEPLGTVALGTSQEQGAPPAGVINANTAQLTLTQNPASIDVVVTGASDFLNITTFPATITSPAPGAPPVLTNPTGIATGTTTSDGTVTTDEPSGTLFSLVSKNLSETVNDIKTLGNNQPVTVSGVQNVNDIGLDPGSNYYYHYVHTDTDGDSNISVSPLFNVPFGIAVLSNPTQPLAPFTTLTASIDTDTGGGTLFYLVDTNATALAAAIKAGDSKAVIAVGTQNITKPGLAETTQYWVHYIQTTSGDSNIVNSLPVTTGGVLPVDPNATLDDAILVVTGEQSVNKGLAIWFSQTANETLQDAEYRWLGEQGTTGNIGDRWLQFLSGYAGTVNDRQLQYWRNGGA